MKKIPDKPHLLIVAGTRPEAIKVAPIALELRARTTFSSTILDTGQHPDMLAEALAQFGLKADITVSLDRKSGSLPELASRLFTCMERVLSDNQFDGVIVQGDTLSTCIAAQTAFLLSCPVFHVEAGLRSYDLDNPFPEEGSRRIVSQIATLHLCPTDLSRRQLLAEGVSETKVSITGNTVVDAVRLLSPLADAVEFSQIQGLKKYQKQAGDFQILVTCHRRENQGDALERVLDAVSDIHERFESSQIIFPVHPNPAVKMRVENRLGKLNRVHLTPPLPYVHLLKILKTSDAVITDSGGLQEEAPAFGPSLVIIRKVTERPEVLEYPHASLVGTDASSIIKAIDDAWQRRNLVRELGSIRNPFGDGYASKHIADRIGRYFGIYQEALT